MSKQEVFFSDTYKSLIDSPNGPYWFHSMPLPDGRRISGVNHDKDRERKLWSAHFPTPGVTEDAFKGKRVLDIGANDGYFTIGACLAGAEHVVAINPRSSYVDPAGATQVTFPDNLWYAAKQWEVEPEIIEGDFMQLEALYDTILFFGVLYHCENVYLAMRRLASLLAPGGTIFIETQVTRMDAELPMFEMASDIYPTTVPQYKGVLDRLGDSNYLLPNDAAVLNLCDSVGLWGRRCASSVYEATQPHRRLFTAKVRPKSMGELLCR